jgi:hypothetical protein
MRRLYLGRCFPALRQLGTATSDLQPPPSGSHAMTMEFRRFCDEQVAPVALGVPSAAFAAHVARIRHLTLAAAETLIRDSGCFTFEGSRTLLAAPARRDVSDFTPAMMEIAKRIPASGVGATRIKELLSELAPTFSPAAIGTYTLRDALQMFPCVLTLEAAAKGKWLVKPAVHLSPQVDTTSTAAVQLLEHVVRRCSSAGGPAQLSSIAHSMGVSRAEIAAVLKGLDSVLDVTFDIKIRPKCTSRACIAFVDGNGVSVEDVESVFSSLGYSAPRSHVIVVRHGMSVAHGPDDVVVDDRVPCYMAVEQQALLTRAAASVVLKDVVYICAPEQFHMFRDNVGSSVDFPDAMIFVASVGAMAKIK